MMRLCTYIVHVIPEYCAQPLGMQSKPGVDTIPDENIITSSGTGKGRLNEDVWFPASDDIYPQITIYFDEPVNIAAIHVR